MENKKIDIPIINAKDIIQKNEPLTYKDIIYKNALDLSAREIDSFIENYTKYFDDLAGKPFGSSPKSLHGFIEKKNSVDYAVRMIRKILSRDNITHLCHVALCNGEVKGFITGRKYPDSKGWISHFYLLREFTARDRLLIESELFKNLCKDLKYYGMTEVYTEAENNPYLVNTLLQLGFEEKEEEELFKKTL